MSHGLRYRHDEGPMIVSPTALSTIGVLVTKTDAHSKSTSGFSRRRPNGWGLLPWMVYLGLTLPHRYEARHWSVLWIGYDAIELFGADST